MKQTTLSYSGTLILETKTRTALKKNHGTINLFRLLTTVLCKEQFSALSLPTYFMLYNVDPSTIVSDPIPANHRTKQLLNNYISIISQTEEDLTLSPCFASTFTATISASMLIGQSNIDNGVTLALVSGDKQSILAAVEFDHDVFNIVSAGGQTFVKWIMSIANADDLSSHSIETFSEE